MSRSNAGPATIIIDTREQEGYSFDSRLAATVRRALPAGDYSVAGLEGLVAVERGLHVEEHEVVAAVVERGDHTA